jgi:hypothetical protein
MNKQMNIVFILKIIIQLKKKKKAIRLRFIKIGTINMKD